MTTTIVKKSHYGKQRTSKNVTYILDREFHDIGICAATLGNSVKSIGESAFAANRLTSVVIPDSVTSIGKGAFYKNPITSVVLSRFLFDSLLNFEGGLSRVFWDIGLITFDCALFTKQKRMAEYNKVIALSEKAHAEAYLNRGLVHNELGAYKKAIADYNKAIALGDAEMQVWAYLNKGLTHNALGAYRKAIADSDKAIALGDAQIQAEAYLNRGVAHNALGEHWDALADYDKAMRKAIELGDTQMQAEAYLNRGVAQSELEKKE